MGILDALKKGQCISLGVCILKYYGRVVITSDFGANCLGLGPNSAMTLDKSLNFVVP